MANIANKSNSLFDDDFFDDSSLLANFENSAFKETSLPHRNLDKTLDKSLLNISALCCDEEISGYDKLTGKIWVYPTNYPVREYQFNIIKAAILKNTLVSLPTGLGKTFIAAVIMYNFYRWYPLGKIVFTAPTRPLVAQQIEACYNIVALPPADTIEMTGHMPVNTRKTHWQTKRVFFATPQVIYNDIKSGICPGQKIRCLVIDEAHRARGNYAYCQIISTLNELGHTIYRVLALSATPGSKVEDVINVVKNLLIAHLELRTENCIDVVSYSHSRKISTVVIPLGPELTQLRKQFVEIMDGYARRLKQFNILPQNLGNMSKGRIVMLYKEYQSKDRGARHPQHNYIMKDFTLIISLYHGLELLVKHGSRVFLNFFDDHPEKSWIQSDDKLTALLERLRDDLGIDPLSLDRSVLPDGTIPEMPKELSFGHPKFDKLKEIMIQHFKNAKDQDQDTKAIVFCEYRESVNLVHCLLLQCRPLIVPQMFVGQGASGKNGKTVVSQKQQLRVMRSFRSGECNALVCTCVAEEGLDVGSVDLILCFDISTRSPVRLVQRCGRTGRERGGQVYILVTEGREHQTLIDCMRQRDGLNKKILQSKEVESNLYKLNPRMIPRDFVPECQKMYITVPKTGHSEGAVIDKMKKGQKDLRNMLGQPSTSTSKAGMANNVLRNSEWVTEAEFDAIYPKGYRNCLFFAEPMEYWSMTTELSETNKNEALLKPSTWLDLQRTLQKTAAIGHSVDSNILAELLRYNLNSGTNLQLSNPNPIASSQDKFSRGTISSPVKSKLTKKQKIASSPNKNGDIRALFSTAATKSTKVYTKLINDLDIDDNMPTRIINLLVDLSMNKTNFQKQCYICQNVCNCSIFQNFKSNKRAHFDSPIGKPDLPDINLIANFNAELLARCVKSKSDRRVLLDEVNTTVLEYNDENVSKNFDLQFDFDSLDESESSKKDEIISINSDDNIDKYFDVGEDIFADSPPLIENNKNISDASETLEYFGLDNIEDIFEDSQESDNKETSTKFKYSKSNNGINKSSCESNEPLNSAMVAKLNCDSLSSMGPTSPSILSGRIQHNDGQPTSPILCSQSRKNKLTKINDIKSCTSTSTVKKRLNLKAKVSETLPPTIDQDKTHDKSLFTITQLVHMINDSDKSPMTNKTERTGRTTPPNGLSESAILNKLENPVERSSSPILLTQRDRCKSIYSCDLRERKISDSKINSTLNVVISDSDSDFEDTAKLHDNKLQNTESNHTNRTPNKRKLSKVDDITASPYFSKKQKLDEETTKPLTLQEKVLAALKFNNNDSFNNNANAHFVMVSPTLQSQKENEDPLPIKDNDGEKLKNDLAMLQVFRRDSRIKPKKLIMSDSPNIKGPNLSMSRRLRFDESDDDFVNDGKPNKPHNKNTKDVKKKRLVKQKKSKPNDFLDLEAELSDDGRIVSGDELSDESIGSIIDFICDQNTSHEDEEDMHALYLRSVKSPVKGTFKIPQLPNRYDKHEVLSQYVEEDIYEMDSFCVDSHIGLTQVNEVSELEIAEKLLEERRRRKKSKNISNAPKENGDSPIIRRKPKSAKRQIQSDSEDSS